MVITYSVSKKARAEITDGDSSGLVSMDINAITQLNVLDTMLRRGD